MKFQISLILSLFFIHNACANYIGAITWYCTIAAGNCNPGACGISVYPGTLPSGVDGIAAYSINLFPSNMCGQCWEITGTAGSAIVWITDQCGGYPGAPSCFQEAITTGDPEEGCDWCYTTQSQHFDVDDNTFVKLCGNLDYGWCFLTSAYQVSCQNSLLDN